MQDANLNSGTHLFKIRILPKFVSRDFFLNNPLSRTKRFHFKKQTNIEHYSAEMHAPSARDSLLLAKVSKITPPSNANSCEF